MFQVPGGHKRTPFFSEKGHTPAGFPCFSHGLFFLRRPKFSGTRHVYPHNAEAFLLEKNKWYLKVSKCEIQFERKICQQLPSFSKLRLTPPKFNIAPGKVVVGRLLSVPFGKCRFLGAATVKLPGRSLRPCNSCGVCFSYIPNVTQLCFLAVGGSFQPT